MCRTSFLTEPYCPHGGTTHTNRLREKDQLVKNKTDPDQVILSVPPSYVPWRIEFGSHPVDSLPLQIQKYKYKKRPQKQLRSKFLIESSLQNASLKRFTFLLHRPLNVYTSWLSILSKVLQMFILYSLSTDSFENWIASHIHHNIMSNLWQTFLFMAHKLLLLQTK